MRSKSGLDWVHWIPVKSSAKTAQRFSEPGRFGAQEWGEGHVRQHAWFIRVVVVNTYSLYYTVLSK